MEIKKTSATYYRITFLLGFASVITLISLLQWPLTAAIVLGSCVFIQIMYLSKKILDTWKKAVEKNITFEILSVIKSDFPLTESNTETDIQQN